MGCEHLNLYLEVRAVTVEERNVHRVENGWRSSFVENKHYERVEDDEIVNTLNLGERILCSDCNEVVDDNPAMV